MGSLTAYIQWLQGADEDWPISPVRAEAATLAALRICRALLQDHWLPLTRADKARLRTFVGVARARIGLRAEAAPARNSIDALPAADDEQLFPFRRDWLPYFIIAFAAGMPGFLRPRVSYGDLRGNLERFDLDPRNCVALRGLPPEVQSDAALQELLRGLPYRASRARVLPAEGGGESDALVELEYEEARIQPQV